MAVKKYLMVVITCLLVFLVVFLIIEQRVRNLPNPYSHKYQLLQKAEYLTLVLGSSHAYFGVDPQHFSFPTVNASNVSQDFKYDLYLLETAFNFNRGIENVIIPISVFSLSRQLASGQEKWRSFNYSLFMNYRDSSLVEAMNIRNYSVLLASPDVIGLVKRSLKKQIAADWSNLGWGHGFKESADISTLNATGYSAAARHQKSKVKNTLMIESLRGIASLCNRHNARLVLFIPPAYVSYRHHIEAVRLEDISEEVRNLQTRFKNIVFIDYFDDSRFTASDFHDADHLSARGAGKLSRMIDTEIRVLGTPAKH